MNKEIFQRLLDRLEEIGNLPLRKLRIYADDDSRPLSWSRGKCLAEIIEDEFENRFNFED